MSAVLAIDPGGTTGFALWEPEPETFTAWEEPDPMKAIETVVEWAPALTALVCESFRLTPNTLKKTQGGSLIAIELIGALRWVAWSSSVPSFVLQAPADAATFSTPAKLHALGWWTKGSDHARSATKHLVLYLVSRQLIDPRRTLAFTPSEV